MPEGIGYPKGMKRKARQFESRVKGAKNPKRFLRKAMRKHPNIAKAARKALGTPQGRALGASYLRGLGPNVQKDVLAAMRKRRGMSTIATGA